ncbi:MAG: glycosyltransferase [Mucilaginibacter sp.]|nr:glycosyltransferase [Mucilaginibacter sp.]
MKHHLSKAQTFVFAAEEDFGILPVEAQTCGTPVIAYGKGVPTETVIENKTGVYFTEQSESSIINAVNYFENNLHPFNAVEIAKHASLYASKRFRQEISAYLSEIVLRTTN